MTEKTPVTNNAPQKDRSNIGSWSLSFVLAVLMHAGLFFGLFAAIPAVAAYNRFANDVERLSIRFESFAEEFQNILQRQRG